MERNLRKERVGIVVSDKMDKTVVVAVSDKKKDPLYKKTVTTTKKFKAHDENNECGVGDTVRIHNRIKEGARERIQLFEGVVIAKHGGGISETFTVRRVSYSVGVEKTFPIHSPNVVKVDIVRSGVVRRAKLYYLRDRVGKASKVKEKI